MNDKRLLCIKEDLYAKSFLCGVPIYVKSCFACPVNDDKNTKSFHFEIVLHHFCLEFMNYIYDFADDFITSNDNGFLKLNVVFS